MKKSKAIITKFCRPQWRDGGQRNLGGSYSGATEVRVMFCNGLVGTWGFVYCYCLNSTYIL